MKKMTADEVINFLDYAVHLHKKQDGGSILKYAVSLVVYQLKDSAVNGVFDYILNLSWHYPILIPYIGILIDDIDTTDEQLVKKFQSLLRECIINNRSDGVSWMLHYFIEKEISLNQEIVTLIVGMKDCLSLCILDNTNKYEEEILHFTNSITSLNYEYDIDRYWLLFYQRFYYGKCHNPYNDKCFDIMKMHKVNFMPTKEQELTQAVKYCYYYNNPFNDDDILPFKDWLAANITKKRNPITKRLGI